MTDVSFLIPARNEEKHLGACVASIQQHAPRQLSCEIIIADNYSLDDTFEMAKFWDHNSDSTRAYQCEGTVAGVRNFLADAARGKLLVFLDADTVLTRQWAERFINICSALSGKVTGSVVRAKNADDFLTVNWFSHIGKRRGEYLNGAHMIVSKQDFESIGGFDEDLVTGEDVDFCQRAKFAGMLVQHDDGLVVFHQRYPKTVREFFARERWHAAGDYQSPMRVLRSKPALAGMVYLWTIVVALFAPWRYSNPAVVLLALMPTAMSFYKFRSLDLKTRLNNILLSAVYLVARGLPKWEYSR